MGGDTGIGWVPDCCCAVSPTPTFRVPSSRQKLRHSGARRNPGLRLRTSLLPSPPRPRRVSPRQARYFLVARQESTQRSVPRLPGLTASDYPRCGRPAGPVAKLAARCAVVVGQRDRTSPGEPPSLGGSEGDEKRRAWWRESECNVPPFEPVGHIPALSVCCHEIFTWARALGRTVRPPSEGKAVPLFTIRLLPNNRWRPRQNRLIQMALLPSASPALCGTRRSYGDKPVAP